MSLPVRILVAGIVGGILVFFTGAFEHMVLEWGGRSISSMEAKQDAQFRDELKAHKLAPAIYGFPRMSGDQKGYAEEYKAGPSGLLIVAPSGEEPMSGGTLGMELTSNIFAALIAAWIVSLISAEKTFLWRWKAVVLMAIFGWLSLSASYGIWYRFPWPFVRDDLLCTLLEWCIGGAAIAAIIPSTAKEKK